MTDETTTAAGMVRSQSKPTTTLYNKDPEGRAVQAAATDSEAPCTVEDTQPSFATSEKLSTSSKPEEESPTENELYSTSQSVPKSSGDPVEANPDGDDARRVQEEVSYLHSAEGLGRG